MEVRREQAEERWICGEENIESLGFYSGGGKRTEMGVTKGHKPQIWMLEVRLALLCELPRGSGECMFTDSGR